MSHDLAALTLVELAEAIADGSITSAAATAWSLERLRRIGPQLNSIAVLADDAVLEQAEALDRERAAGRLRGKLHGVPLAHKDLFYRAGRVAASGSKVRAGFVPDTTATVLERLDDAGALDLGSLHMCEFAYSPTGYNQHMGHARNPWDPARVPGGSSSGSGASVGARLVHGSLGTDSGGSIRHPASLCGLTGLKPTQTRVSRFGVLPLSHSLDCVGPLAPAARDVARLLAVIAGPDARDPTASTHAVPDYESLLDGDIRGLRIAVPDNYYYDTVTDEVRALLDASLDALRGLGASVVRVTVPDIPQINSLAQLVMAVEAATVHRKGLAERRDDYGAIVRSRVEPGLLVPAVRYCEALNLRARITATFLDATLGQADVLHLPAVTIPVPTIEETTTDAPGPVNARLGAITHATRGINYLGLPAASVPMGFTGNGMPAGFQLVGRPFDEGLLLRMADAYQRVTDWHRRHPGL
jgi:aspartyl-tRNA(Asn)/glutamyl-tRNA(Gln) amidotransferase subunit A